MPDSLKFIFIQELKKNNKVKKNQVKKENTTKYLLYVN